jgi:DNA transposition AAA+ family ATPase
MTNGANGACQLRSDVENFLASRPDLNMADVAQYTTLAPATVRAYVTGNIAGGETVQAELRRVLGQARAGDILQPGSSASVTIAEDPAQRVRKVSKTGTFYSTQTVRKICEVLDYCVENSAIGVITADFGTGKTEAIRWWRRKTKAESVVFEFDEFSAANKIQTLRMICEALAINATVTNHNAGSAFRVLCVHLRENPCLLIFDQAEMVRPRVLQILRQLWDRTADAGVGMVLLAAPIMLSRMLTGNMADMGALTSRVGIWAPLSGITRSEMSAIVKQEGFDQVDEDAFDLWYKAIGGSMRRLMRSLDLLKAKHQGKRISEKTICGVAGMLWGLNMDVRAV